ncbi:uncharacterized protein [Dermacentor albipictus]|uniref:uncharacterized protein isoform X8 n=1 Tax=Dermacentor albipictus TaxID=60249 RepID=UPI0038FC56C9
MCMCETLFEIALLGLICLLLNVYYLIIPIMTTGVGQQEVVGRIHSVYEGTNFVLLPPRCLLPHQARQRSWHVCSGVSSNKTWRKVGRSQVRAEEGGVQCAIFRPPPTSSLLQQDVVNTVVGVAAKEWDCKSVCGQWHTSSASRCTCYYIIFVSMVASCSN